MGTDSLEYKIGAALSILRNPEGYPPQVIQLAKDLYEQWAILIESRDPARRNPQVPGLPSPTPVEPRLPGLGGAPASPPKPQEQIIDLD